MCTTGLIRSQKSSWLLGFKTFDAAPTGIWHAEVKFTTGMKALAVGATVQTGINSGLNDKGLCSILSYLDTQIPKSTSSVQEANWVGDNRGVANASMLASCTSVKEAAKFLQLYFKQYPSSVGGNFLLSDAEGAIGILEYYNGQTLLQVVNEDNYLVRANNGNLLGLQEQSQLPDEVKQDRQGRYKQAQELCFDISTGSKDTALKSIKSFLSSHGENGLIPVCVHDYDIIGARYSRIEPITTVTALVFDILNYGMWFSESSPCSSQWNFLSKTSVAVA